MFLHFSFDSFHAILFMILFLHVLSAYQTSFDFSDFAGKFQGDSCSNGGNYVCLQGNASVIDGVIELNTEEQSSVGRAVYSQPVRIWNNSTGKAANFTTTFSFNIRRIPTDPFPGDGLAFFLSPYPSIIPNNSTGGRLGLVGLGSSQVANFVAVEFDTYPNQWDPESSHVGIDLNSIISNTTVNVNFSGAVGRAVVKYNADTLNLSVSVFYSGDPFLNGNTILWYLVNISDVLPENVAVGFTAATGMSTEHHQIFSWAFTSSLLDDDTNVQKKNDTSEIPKANNNSTTITNDNNNNHRRLVVMGTSVGAGLLIISVCVVLWFIFFHKTSKATPTESKGNGNNTEAQRIDEELKKVAVPYPREIPYEVLVKATSNFNSEAKIGEGGFGSVYKGLLSEQSIEVAIKRLSVHANQGPKEYIAEINIISAVRHKNLVRLVGWCHEKSDLLLVYEYMPRGSLDLYLFNTKFLSWKQRYKIALDLASALLYLHEECQQYVVHRDVKSNNVMWDSDYNAKLGDFGLARLSEHGKELETTGMAGTIGYLPPEYANVKPNKKFDVYSFGVVALEIACGRRCINKRETSDASKRWLVGWVWQMYGKETLLEALDRRFHEKGDEVNEEQARRLMVVGLWCCHPQADQRPSIREAIGVLNNLRLQMPILPSAMPIHHTFSFPLSQDEHSDGTKSIFKSATSNATDKNLYSEDPPIVNSPTRPEVNCGKFQTI